MITLENNPAPQPLNMRSGWVALRQLPLVDPAELAGQTHRFRLEDGSLSVEFGGDSAVVDVASPGYSASFHADDLDIVQSRPGFRYIDLADTANARSLTLFVSDEGAVLAIFNDVETRDGRPNVVQRVFRGLSDSAPADTPLFEQSSDLVGQRAVVSYQEDHVLEHVYLNTGAIAWQLLQGVNGAGHAEAHQATTWKVAEGLYVLAWVEHNPVAVLLLMDFDAMLNTGKVMAIDDSGFVNEKAGARIDYFGAPVWYPSGSEPK